MESKGEAKGGEEQEQQQQQPPPKNLVMRFCEFAFRVLNHDMDDFFEDSLADFDQDGAELSSGQGETLQQYEVYQAYIAQLERHFDG
jgi:hypothetical protein